ncbi:MAG: DNA translocase FtsK 4TM domain-containing protein, partial [Chloroflexota bacterium]
MAAIAVVAFALLSLVALVTDQGPLLQWWRELLVGMLGIGRILVPPVLGLLAAALWWPPLRARLALPMAGGFISVVAVLGILEVAFADPTATGDRIGGGVGRLAGRAIEGALGTWGGMVALLALFAVGIVIAANRTLAELVAPALRRRPAFVLRPGTTLPGGGRLSSPIP